MIDNQNINQIVLQRLLSKYGMAYEGFSNSNDALQKLLNENYDIIFVNQRFGSKCRETS